MKRYVDDSVRCPFYKSEERQKIFCEGLIPRSSSIQAFATPKAQKDYEDYYCKKCWEKCLVACTLNRKYERE